jgi:hypothetical protein
VIRLSILTLTAALSMGLAAPSYAVLIFSPGGLQGVTNDTVFGGQLQGPDFVVGGVGFNQPGNNWPGAELPESAIDGVGQKYLNFGEENTGIVVTPANGISVATSITLYNANDAEERSPRSFELWGSDAILGVSSFALSDFTLIANGPVNLPAGTNPGGNSALGSNFETIEFANEAPYTSYMILFPDLNQNQGGFGDANSMQISEIVLEGNLVPEPSTSLLALFGGLFLFRRRR